MNARLRDLHAQRKNAVTEMRNLSDTALTEERDMSEEESKRHDALFDQAAKLKDEIKKEERLIELERETADEELRTRDIERDASRGNAVSKEDRQMIGFRCWLLGMGLSGDNCAEFRNLQSGYEARGLDGIASEEVRALQADSGSAGGFLLAPPQFVNELIKDVDDMIYIRQRATTYQVTGAAEGLGAPSLDNDPDDFDWTVELSTGEEDGSMSFGKRELKAHPFAKRIKVSRKLMRKAGVDRIIRQRFGYKVGLTQEKAYFTGDGQQKPLGLFTASNNGIPTTRDVSADNTTSQVKADNILNMFYSLKMQYRSKADWLFHRDTIKQISKLKDGEGRYLWQDAIRAGDPDTIKGRPVLESEHVPNTYTTGQYVGLLGDLSQYWIVDDLAFEMQILNELYAETNQVGFIGRYEGDGMPVLAEAFSRMKLA